MYIHLALRSYICVYIYIYIYIYTVYIYIYIYIYTVYTFTFSYLADTFIQSDLQMRTMEAINKYNTINKKKQIQYKIIKS